ncbi:hypothetical protein B0T22DRAFT_540358 [Podospora appendiculata]|uniref:TauD/TfdA-like domain-containing protein n=1 Tax=Podospora appendiculata TaxID=314037 RepID=A0AAE1C719_9PEZI|nr:hypothetical protein B0T22DRAFT_540358 [Podospora appendiculata]
MSTTTTITEAESSLLKLTTLAYDKDISPRTTKLPALQPFAFRDRGLAADNGKPNLLPKDHPDIKATNLTPVIGTEIRGLQFSALSDTVQKDELALLIAERGVVVFRDQGFKGHRHRPSKRPLARTLARCISTQRTGTWGTAKCN